MTYVAIKTETVKQKVKFEKQFKKFVTGGFQFEDFPVWFYKRLSMCFGHIAHYSRHNFYNTWFTKQHHRQDFIDRIKEMEIYGDPTHTYSDVEKALQSWLRENY